VRVKPLGAVGAVLFFVCILLLAAAPTQAEWPSIQPSKGPPSGIAQKFLNGLRNPGAQHHRTVSSPPLPRPRATELPRQSVELNKAAPVAPTLDPPTGVEHGKVLGGGPPKSDQTPDANRAPAESAAIDLAKASAETAAPVEPDGAPPAEPARVSGSNKARPELPPEPIVRPAQGLIADTCS
jgi:hypothetical protein